MIKVGIVGIGAIGTELARRCLTDFKNDVQLIGLTEQSAARERSAQKRLKNVPALTLHRLAAAADLVIEAASGKAAWPVACEALSQGKDVMILSVGGLIHHEKELYRLAREHRSCVYLPSGALAGVDALKSARLGRIRSVTLTTRKSPAGLKNAPFISKRRIRLNALRKDTLLFSGSAERAVEGFPQNVNISATLSLAGLGARRTRVNILACPGLKRHVHEVRVEGEFGSYFARTENVPALQNPRTSRLAVLSAVATLKRILDYVKIGT